MTDLAPVSIYTDGACLGNPGPGGYCAIVESGRQRQEMTGGYRRTTNNRMEMMAAIAGLESLKTPSRVTLYSDSQYLVNAISHGWAVRWRANRWMRTRKDKAINPDLWDRILKLCEKHSVEFIWIRGHSANPENERCDRLAVAAAGKPNLPSDAGYEAGSPGSGRLL